MDNNYVVPAKTRIGHVHLKVSDLEQSLAFYCGLLGFELQATYGTQAAFISAGGYHHHIGLNTWHSKGASPAPVNSAGLYHVAILYPTRKDLAVIYKRLLDARYPLSGASDHGVSEAIYLDDPDMNGLELYYDRSENQWPKKEDGSLDMFTRALDVESLLNELK
jgi:catechol 2,3-dioxygenase